MNKFPYADRIISDIAMFLPDREKLEAMIEQAISDCETAQALEPSLQSPRLDGIGSHTSQVTSQPERYVLRKMDRETGTEQWLLYLQRMRNAITYCVRGEMEGYIADGLSTQNIAATCNVTSAAVYKAKERLLEKIASEVKRYYDS